MKKLEEMGLVPSNKKECVEHDGGNDKPVFKGIKPDASQNSSFWAPLKSTTPKWWLINYSIAYHRYFCIIIRLAVFNLCN